ncbi:MAG: disulfide bond formation protein B [Wenzhouxiangellaceae bacterium]|nr:disulfide bond formation protein B [Wenzhouxiangellaceae bacterium]
MNIQLFPRAGFALVFFASLCLLGFAYFVQYQMQIDPCPLCILQRVAFMIMGLGALLGAVHGSRGWPRWAYGGIIAAGGLWGVATAGRHVWLQSLPADQVPDCGPGFGFMMEYFSVGEAVKSAFTGSGECAEVDWSLIGISMPGWTLIWYVVLMILTVAALRKAQS